MDRIRNLWDAFLRHCSDAFSGFVRYVARWLLTIGDAVSQLLNVVIFFSQNANESISGRAWRLHKKYAFWYIIKVSIDWLASPMEADHCQASHKADVARAARLLREQA